MPNVLPPLVTIVACFTLAACTSQGSDVPQATAPAPQLACGADKVANYIGVAMTDDVLAKIKATAGARLYRVVGPRDPMTMDYREDRLTITTGDDGLIKTLRCV